MRYVSILIGLLIFITQFNSISFAVTEPVVDTTAETTQDAVNTQKTVDANDQEPADPGLGGEAEHNQQAVSDPNLEIKDAHGPQNITEHESEHAAKKEHEGEHGSEGHGGG